MKVLLIPEKIVVEGYLMLSSLELLLIKYPDELVKQKGTRWDSRRLGNYEIIQEEQ
jgi:hypothetical protein